MVSFPLRIENVSRKKMTFQLMEKNTTPGFNALLKNGKTNENKSIAQCCDDTHR